MKSVEVVLGGFMRVFVAGDLLEVLLVSQEGVGGECIVGGFDAACAVFPEVSLVWRKVGRWCGRLLSSSTGLLLDLC